MSGITNQNSFDAQAGNGVTTDFNFTFFVYQVGHVKVYEIDTANNNAQTDITNIAAVSINTNNIGGIAVVNPPPDGDKIILMQREVPYEQNATFENLTRYKERTIEEALNTLEMQIQQVKDISVRSISYSPVANVSDAVIDAPVDGQFLIFNGTDGRISAGGDAADIANAQGYAAAAAASAADAAGQAGKLTGTSASSNSLGTGVKTFVTQAGKDFAIGRHVLITSDASPTTRRMSGMVVAYAGTSLQVDVETVTGAGGPYTDWTIRIDGERGAQGGASGTQLTINEQTDSYTPVIGDLGKQISMNKATANNLTVPPNSAVAFPIGTQIAVHQKGAGQTTIVAGVGVTVNVHSYFSLKLRGQHSKAVLIKEDTNVWTLNGHLELA